MDMNGGHNIAYEEIISESLLYQCPPVFLQEDSEELSRWPELTAFASKWMEDVRQIAVAGYKQVLEDGAERCDSESDSEHSDHGDDIPISSMYTPELITMMTGCPWNSQCDTLTRKGAQGGDMQMLFLDHFADAITLIPEGRECRYETQSDWLFEEWQTMLRWQAAKYEGLESRQCLPQ
jgi:hypothetical protein